MVAIAWAGVPGDTDESRLFGFFLAASITLSLSAAFTVHVSDPRAAYRLGWDARGRREDATGDTATLREQRHA